jgi:hypothetical protein
MWSSSDVRAVLNKYGPTLTQCGPECPVILSECGPVIRMFLGRGVYILGPLQIVRRQPSLFEPALEGVTARNGPHFVR